MHWKMIRCLETCNPCCTGDTKILTDKGYLTIKECEDIPTNIWNGYKFSLVTPKKTGENQELYRIEFSNGSVLKCTPYHKFILKDHNRVEAKDLCVGDKLVRCSFPIINGENTLRNAYTQGFFSGDGFVCSDRKAKYISFYGKKKELSQYCDVISQRECSELRDTYSIDVDFDKDFVPINYDVKSKCEWLSGIVDSDGGNTKDGGIQITSINQDFLINIKYMLNTMGVDCTVSLNKKGENKNIKGKDYYCKDSYRVVIAASDVAKLNSIGFNPHRIKNTSTYVGERKRYISVKRIEKLPYKEDVYCFTEPYNHSGIFNGVITSQCGEQPLAKDFCCNLGSINLAEFVIDEYTENAHIDINEFRKAINIAIEALDDLIDENADNHPLEVQKINSLNYRNIGLGLMGVGTALFKLGLKYGSEEAKGFINDIFAHMFRESVYASVALAKTKGVFSKYKDCIFDSEIIEKHFDESEIKKFKTIGIRNCSLLSIAPTGSISTMLGVTGGCEPEFAIKYTRKTDNLDDSYDVFCNEAQYYMKKFNTNILPDYFVCSSDINYKDRIDMQAIMQEHIDTAISSTVNLPNDILLEDVEKLYLYAWQKGLKGITIFRDGCKRMGILTTDSNKNSDSTYESNEQLQRGDIVEVNDDVIGKKRKLNTGCGTLHCEAFFDPTTGELMETYLSKGSLGGCNNFMIGLSRLISLLARSGCNIYTIAEQLDSCGVCPSYAVRSATKHDTSKGSCCPMAVGKALIDMYEEMIDDLGLEEYDLEDVTSQKTNSTNSLKCPECGSQLYFEGGCNICKNCGWSKCN